MKAVKISIAALAVAGLCAGLTGRANAQAPATTTEVTKPFTVKLGALFLADKDAGDTALTLGIGYDFLKTKSTNPLILQGYLDYIAGTEKSTTVGNVTAKAQLEYGIGVGVAARYKLMQENAGSAGFSPYGFLGLGVYSVKVKGEVRTGATGSIPASTVSGSDTKTGLGGKLGLGAEMKSGIFGELEYNFLPSLEGYNPSGFGARIGYRF
jgi:hypothetical protein